MSLNVSLTAITQPGSTGNQTISLAANFDPKVIILWCAGRNATGVATNGQMGLGFGTYRGSTVQQGGYCYDDRHAAVSGITCREMYNNALLCIPLAGTPDTRDLEIDLVSMQGGSTSQVVINWVNLHSTAVIVTCLILGGSEISDALVTTFTPTTAVANQNVTVVSGFGQPDLVFMCGANNVALNTLAGHAEGVTLGVGKKGQAGQHYYFSSYDNNTTMFVQMRQRTDMIYSLSYSSSTDSPADTIAFHLDTTTANWPTDGFRIVYDTQATIASIPVVILALKGTFTATTGNGTAPITGTPPVTQNLDHGSVPKLGLFWGWDLVAQTGYVASGTDLGACMVGAGDGTNEFCQSMSDSDALGTSDCRRAYSNTKVIQNYGLAAVLKSEADGSISGNNFVLSWSTIDTVARQYLWLTMGDASGPTTITGVGSSTGTGAASGAGIAIWDVVGSSSGVSTVSGSSGTILDSAGASAGVGAATANSATIVVGVGSCAGLGAATANSATILDSVGSASGVGTATGVGDTIVVVVGSSNGLATVTGIAGDVVSTGVGSSSGTSTVTGKGFAVWSCVGSSAGVGTASSNSSVVLASAGSSSGVGTATGSSATLLGSSASSAGVGTALGVGGSISIGVGSSGGVGIAQAVGEDASGTVVPGTGDVYIPVFRPRKR